MTQTDHLPSRSDLVKLYRQAVAEGLSIEKVEEKINKRLERAKVTAVIEEQADQLHSKKTMAAIPRLIRWGASALPVLFIGLGLALVGSAVIPIMGYYLTTMPELRLNDLASPIPQDKILDVNPLVINQVRAATESGADNLGGSPTTPIFVDTALDFTNLTNWFGSSLPQVDKSGDPSTDQSKTVAVYRIDIPKLNIVDAKVTVGGDDLNKSLVHYSGTALPGQPGSPVIFGHSVLRQFYNPKITNPRRYNSIFSTIMTLQKGDKIMVTIDNVQYTYMVQDKSEVKPTDVYILAQRYDARQLKLVTCVPEGTYLKRGVVTAQLIE